MKYPSRSATATLFSRMAFVALLLVVSGCTGDPRADAIDERGRWNVDLRRWFADEQGRIVLDTQVTGPVSSSIDTLTFRVDVLDAHGNPLGTSWQHADLTKVSRGTPTDMLFYVSGIADAAAAEGVRIDLMRSPTDEEAAKIEELQVAER